MGSDSLALLILVTGITTAGHNPEASRKAQDAYLRYTGANDLANDYLKKVQTEAEKETPEEVRFYMGGALYLSKTIIDKKIVIRWTF
jgi:hypothetical protein